MRSLDCLELATLGTWRWRNVLRWASDTSEDAGQDPLVLGRVEDLVRLNGGEVAFAGSPLRLQERDRFEIATRRFVYETLRDDLPHRDPLAPAVLGDGDPGVEFPLYGSRKILGAARPDGGLSGLPPLSFC